MSNKQVSLKLVGLDGNAFSLMGAFAAQAQEENWTDEEIDEVLKEAKSGDYDNLLRTLSKHCKDPEE
jgi:hypothetical protein